MSDEVWMWLYQKHVMSWIVQKLYWVGTNNCTYLAVPDNFRFYQRNSDMMMIKKWDSTNKSKISTNKSDDQKLRFNE